MKRFILAFAAATACSSAAAQGYPSKPITFVIPFAAGGDSDLSGRNVAQPGLPKIRSPAETERFVHDQYELYDKLVTALGIRQ